MAVSTICTHILRFLHVVRPLSFFHVGCKNTMGFPGSSAGKESTCNAGDPTLIPGSGRSPEEGIGYPLQYSWASLVIQTKESACNVGDLGSIPGL